MTAAIRCPPMPDPMTPERIRELLDGATRRQVYIASKAKYGLEWVAKREAGYPISSTWIDQCGFEETSDWPALWMACITEASQSAALVLICRDGDILKGAWVEVGAALACGVPVFAVGVEAFSIRHHPSVTLCVDEREAFIKAHAETYRPAALRAKAKDARG